MNSKDNIVSDTENQWIAYLNGEPDIADSIDLDEKQKASLTRIWEFAGTKYSYSAADPEKALNKVRMTIAKSNRILNMSFFRRDVFKYAAMLVLAMGIGFAVFQLIRKPKNVEDLPVRLVIAETDAHPVSVMKISLSDGSFVRLNANTKIEYPEHFTGKIRKVKLLGEAFFEVTKDSMHPFRIETPNASVEVLGTSFNVSAYPNADKVEVNVETGRVRLSEHPNGSTELKFVVLPAGERGWLKVSKGEIGHKQALEPNYAAWMTKNVSFQRTPLIDVCSVLENTYHVKFRLENPEIGEILYTANFADLNLDYIVKVIARTHHLQVKKNGDEIILTRRAK